MKVKNVLAGLLTIALAGFAQAQDGWNWPSDPAMEAKAREFNAAYVDYMKAEQFIEATRPLHWLLVNVPSLNESIYINGVTVYNGAATATTDAAQKRVYQDSVITIYDLRREFFNNETRWIENKAYYGYLYYRDDKNKLAEAVSFYDRAFEVNGTINPAYAAAYFDLIRRHFLLNRAYTEDQVLAIHEKISDLLEEAEASGIDVSTPKSNVEALLIAMELINCDFIENNLGGKLQADPTNLVLAKQVFKYAVQYKCTGTNAFLAALEVIDSDNPTFSTTQVRAMRYMASREFDKAQPALERALTLAENDKQRADVQMDLAKIHAQLGRKSAARAAAQEAARLDSERTSDAYNMIGYLIMGSFNDCRGGESRAKDFSLFIAAYNAFQRAGNSEGMREARARFPSKEELFTEGKMVGDTINTGCWVGETVTLATRD